MTKSIVLFAPFLKKELTAEDVSVLLRKELSAEQVFFLLRAASDELRNLKVLDPKMVETNWFQHSKEHCCSVLSG